MPYFSPGPLEDLDLEAPFAAQRPYMRSRIFAQSGSSVPPASDWIVTTASPESVPAGEERVLLQPFELAPQRHDRFLDVVREILVERQQLPVRRRTRGSARRNARVASQSRVLGRDSRCEPPVVPESRLAELLLQLGRARPQSIRVKGNH